ncbi:type II toxin-antitoxin system RelE/ParE family toxin [Undibacterium danionis]|uniref:Type II toxin-antitoxin system RelE/ParE family toxin n=1 Tax=Undibacterium danionis TaxID=1812100 RepID=A0ABV6IF99_9BURK
MQVKFHTEAEAELTEAALYYEDKVAGLGKSFVADIQNAVTFIRLHPDTPPRLGQLLRKFVVKRFPYSIIYQHDEHGIFILAVAHNKRRPGMHNVIQ